MLDMMRLLALFHYVADAILIAVVACGMPGARLASIVSPALLVFLMMLRARFAARPSSCTDLYGSDRSGCGGCSLLGIFGRKLREAHQGELPCPGGLCSSLIETCNRRQFRMLSAIAEKPSSHWSSRTAETFARAPRMPSSACTSSSKRLAGIKTGLC